MYWLYDYIENAQQSFRCLLDFHGNAVLSDFKCKNGPVGDTKQVDNILSVNEIVYTNVKLWFA